MPTPEEVMADPGYQFGMNQGMQAIDRRLAAIGGRRSGCGCEGRRAVRHRLRIDAVRRGLPAPAGQLNRLAALAGIGQTATGASAAAGQKRHERDHGPDQQPGRRGGG